MKQFLSLLLIVAAFELSVAEITSTIYPCPPFGLSRLPHSTSCDKYVQCFAGEAVVQECGTGLHYNTTAEKCMDSSIADCYRTVCPLYNDPEGLVYLPDYLDCEKYYLCYDNEPKPYRCADGLHWDEENQYCTSPAEAACVDYAIVCDPDSVHNAPNPRFCDQYYICLRGDSFPTSCPDGLVFDTEWNRCDYRGTATCYPGSLLP